MGDIISWFGDTDNLKTAVEYTSYAIAAASVLLIPISKATKNKTDDKIVSGLTFFKGLLERLALSHWSKDSQPNEEQGEG